MNVLILGGGGREHALAWKIKQSPLLNNLYVVPGNGGTKNIAHNINLAVDDFKQIKTLVLDKSIGMVVAGPEAPLVQGMKDFFQNDEKLKQILFFGPDRKGATLEGSKDWAKNFMKKYSIPTASHKTFDKKELNIALEYLESITPPYVIKADGLAAGKGVVICRDKRQARSELKAMLGHDKFGEASRKVVIEKFLEGIELSVFVITDGKDYLMLPAAKDYKRVGEGDTGLNTGGMGSVSPVPFAGKEFMDKVEHRIIQPTIKGLQEEKIDYQGFIFFGLMKVGDDPYMIEYNVRMGDPEAEAIIPRLDTDLLELMAASASGHLKEKSLKIDPRYSASVMLVSGGYPEKYEKGKKITGISQVENSIVFHAGTKENNHIETSGGRVIAVTGMGQSLENALENAYEGCEIINFEGKYYRKDIGNDLRIYLK
ncbi:MAG: phosphoribosylamine--glycine ligase [Bacteroidales bacterium]|nr:phosphoribosylamine--glycine ligase [Bacteroidales bacterium]